MFSLVCRKSIIAAGVGLPELPLLLDNFSEQIQQHFSQVNGTAWAIPFDASMQLLFYRRDLFEDATIKRMFYESTGKELTLPENFAQFDEIAAFFSQLHQPENRQRPMGTAVTLGSSGLIATEYLLRYYALGGRLVREGEPVQLDASLAAAALEEYLHQLSIAVNLPGEWWSDAVKQFERGNLAMLIMYLNLFNDVAHTTIAPTIGYAPVPGQLPQLGGGSIGMSRYSKKKNRLSSFFIGFIPMKFRAIWFYWGATAPGLEYVTIKMFSISTRGLIY